VSGQPLRVVAVIGTTKAASKTKALAELILDRLAVKLEITAEVIEIHTLNPGLGSAIEREQLDERSEAAVQAVENADLVVAATPVFRGAYTGLFKHFFDFVDQYALAGKPVLLAATGGTDRHALVIDQVLRPLFGFFQAWTAPMGVYLSSGDFDGTIVLNPEAYERIDVAVGDLAPVARSMARSASLLNATLKRRWTSPRPECPRADPYRGLRKLAYRYLSAIFGYCG
jgi:FMN reductase